ncbi:hypothetical protein NL676_021620 [Syzygium grande]|nr:hypothetical protein NL676_021620 [Syzygium grande]
MEEVVVLIVGAGPSGLAFCSLPYMPHAPSSSTFMPRKSFVEYIDSYISRFGIEPRYCRSVEAGSYVESERKWRVEARNTSTQEKEVLPGIVRINGNNVMFENGVVKQFNDIIFATGYKSTVNYWLEDYEYIMNKDGMPKCLCPHHWKGENGIYCAGFSRQGLAGIARDAVAIANDISEVLNRTKEKIKIN